MNMGTKAALSVEEYLHTSFPDLDKEYRDGMLVDRTLPDYLHSKTQRLLIVFFALLGRTIPLHVSPELRLKIRENRYLIPDISIFRGVEPSASVPDQPPFIAIEILSPDDQLPAVGEKLREYRAWGVKFAWLFDPHSKRMYTWDARLTEVPTLRIPELGLDVTPADVFES
jgi:Uma2 family endonuclease